MLKKSEKAALAQAFDYYDSVVSNDIKRVDDVDRDEELAKRIMHLRNGSYGLIEIKIGGTELIKEGAESLKSLSSKIDTTKMKRPSFLMVLTGIGDYAYRRPEDGVLVVPIGCLKN